MAALLSIGSLQSSPQPIITLMLVGFALAAGLEPLIGAGILGPRDLPLRIRPDDPAALDGWRFG